MSNPKQNAQLRDQYSYVNFARIRRVLRWAFRQITHRRHPHVKDVSPHIARDIGIDPTDLAPYHHRLPPQHNHHPRS